MGTTTYNPLLQTLPKELIAIELSGAARDGEVYFQKQGEEARRTGLKRVLRWYDLTLLGIGATIGAGIFVVTGSVARDKAGPALCISYIISGFCCMLSSFSYAEFAALSPQSGSAYGYTKATMGTFASWVIGWDLCLEYGVCAAGVAQGFSKYITSLMRQFGVEVSPYICSAPWQYDQDTGNLSLTGSVFDAPAAIVSLFLSLVLVRGIKESTTLNGAMVCIKVGIVLFVIFTGAAFVEPKNFEPFLPFGFFGISFFGYTAVGKTDARGDSVGVLAASSVVFFAYIGFDAVSTQAEEAADPQRDLPRGIIGSLAISTVLYVCVSVVLVGMVPYTAIDRDAPLSSAFASHNLPWAQVIVSLGALAGLSSVLLVNLLGQTRILMAMARDGLLPEGFFCAIHPVYRTPYRATAITGFFVALVGSLIPMSVLVELVSMGTLMAFAFVNISIIILRRTQPGIPRPFVCPWCPFVPGLGAILCFLLMISLPSSNWIRLIGWFCVGCTIYKYYSVPSLARRAEREAREGAQTQEQGAQAQAQVSQEKNME